MSGREWLWAALGAIALAGCAGKALDLAPDRADRPWQPATDSGGEIIPAGTAPAAARTAASYVLPANSRLAELPSSPSFDPAHTYTLAELIDIAQSSHPDTRIAWNNARHAALAAGIAQSAYLPHVSASVIGGYRNARGDRSAPGFSVDVDTSASGATAVLALEWLLFDFGEKEAVIDAAQELSAASNIAFTAAHQRVIHEVCVTFYADAAARARVDTAAQALRNAQEIEEAAQQRYQRGVGTVVEVAQARQASAQARLAQVRATGQAQDAFEALVSAMGVSPLAWFKVADLSRRNLSPTTAQPVERIVADALARRPDVLGANAAQKVRAAQVRAAEAEFKPKVFMSMAGAYGNGRLGVTAVPPIAQLPGTFNLTGTQSAATVLLGLSVPLYDAGLRQSALGQARANADSAAAASERVRIEAVRQIVAAQSALQTSLAAHEASKALQAAAQTTFDAAFDAYRHGVGTMTAVTTASTQLLLAQDAATDAHSGALAAAATLAFATGALGSAPSEPRSP